MKDKFSLAKSIYYIGMINFFGNYIGGQEKNEIKTIYFGNDLKITSKYKSYMTTDSDFWLEYKSSDGVKYTKGQSQNLLIDGVSVILEKNGKIKGEINIGKASTLSATLEEQKEFMNYMLQKPKKRGDFVEMPTNNELNLNEEDQKEIIFRAMDLVRWFDNRILETKSKQLKKQ